MNWLYATGWVLFRALFASYFRWRVWQPENVPATGGVILAANHASYLDPPLVAAGLRRPVNFLARKSLFRFPLLGWVLRRVGAVPLDRDGGSAAGLRTVLEQVKAGRAVILFPEGTRTHDGRLQPARSGIGLMVVKSGVPVVPVRVFGTYEAYGRHRRFPRPRPVAVRYGAPMQFDRLRAEARTASKERLKAIYQDIADEILAAIARLERCDAPGVRR